MWPSSIPHKVSCWPNTLGAAAEMFWKKGKFSLGSLLLQLDLKDNAVDVARIPTDKVAIASVHPGIGEEEHEELHGRSWVFHHNVPGDDVHNVPMFTMLHDKVHLLCSSDASSCEGKNLNVSRVPPSPPPPPRKLNACQKQSVQ